MAEHQVRFLVQAIVGITVSADSFDKAITLAKAKIEKGLFVSSLVYLHGNHAVCGIDNNDLWQEVE